VHTMLKPGSADSSGLAVSTNMTDMLLSDSNNNAEMRTLDVVAVNPRVYELDSFELHYFTNYS